MRGLNVETKARSDDLAALAARSAAAGATYEGRLEQTDTYFAVAGGRLKLREIRHVRPDGEVVPSAELISYERPDAPGVRVSDYDRTEVDDPAAVRLALEREHGVRAIVRKERELWLVGRTRIHLDRVDGLGDYVELETVVGDGPLEDARAEHERLLAELGIDESEGIGVSYVDLATGR